MRPLSGGHLRQWTTRLAAEGHCLVETNERLAPQVLHFGAMAALLAAGAWLFGVASVWLILVWR
jgi:hypothetical protein